MSNLYDRGPLEQIYQNYLKRKSKNIEDGLSRGLTMRGRFGKKNSKRNRSCKVEVQI